MISAVHRDDIRRSAVRVEGRPRHVGRHVLVVLHEAELAGASRAVLHVVPHLEQRGWSFAFWTPSPGPARDELERRGYECCGRPRLLRYTWRSLTAPPGVASRIRSTPRYLRDFRAYANREAPALVHANSLITIPEMIAAGRRHRPSLMYVHEIVPRGAKGEAAARLIRASADTVVACSQAGVNALRAHNVESRLVYNGVHAPPRHATVERDRDRFVVGTLGTVCHRKGSDLFLAAAQEVARRRPDIEFRMVGPLAAGAERPWAQEIVRTARAHGIVCGASADVNAELADWDLLVMPSRAEPLGLAALEAMAMGVPVIAADVGGLPEIVSSATGMLIRSDDVSSLTTAILELERAPARRAQLGQAGRSRVTSDFTLDRQAEGVHQAYLASLASARADR